ncbi:IS1 family transposase [Candidatus Bandiella woodruffii]|uniref:IS1 family transposase n=1 Tax=Candidatus Bandiella euplotis TaxID=1664265 RepID=A0ABZ0UP20_9RICK|nr:IS1 family transposase [Candidatus Bandiella woodruffii]
MVGKRNVTTFRKLWKIISRDNCTYYTDDWSVYSEVIPRHQHVVGKQHTLSIESNNSNTRHRIARMTRKTKVVSKSEEVVDLTIKLWVHFEDNNNFLSEQGNFISILWQHSEIFIVFSLGDSVLFRRNNNAHAQFLGMVNYVISIVPSVG